MANFDIDSNVMTIQPSSIEVEEAEGVYKQTVDGGYLVSVRDKGAIIVVTWGVDVAKTAVIAELRTARGASYAHTIGFTDPSSVAQSFTVLMPPIGYNILTSELYGRFTLRMRERP